MNRRRKTLLTGLLFLFLLNSCMEESEKPDYSIQLRWSKAYPTETREDAILGLGWTLSYLGAGLPEGALENAVTWTSDTHFILDLSRLGFNSNALAAFSQLLPVIRSNEEYQLMGGIDLGRFVMITLNNTHHYYAITGARKNFSTFENSYSFGGKSIGVIDSRVAIGHRLIDIAEQTQVTEIAFIAYEGHGSLVDGTFEPVEIEVMDFLPNGQPRFALYDTKGELKLGATLSLTRAGKPAKCLWCHDQTFQPIFDPQEKIEGKLGWEEFNELISWKRNEIIQYRDSLSTDIDLNDKNGHNFMEYVYLSFMEPSAEKLALEWGLSEAEVLDLLKEQPTHPHTEFTFLGSNLYHRHSIEKFAPYEPLPISKSARETTEDEPNFLMTP